VITSLFKRKTLEDKWTIGWEILNIILVLLFIGLGNMIYGNLLGVMPFTFKNYLGALSIVLMIGIFPVTLHVITKHNKLLKLNLQKASQVNSSLQEPAMGSPGPATETKEDVFPGLTFIAENEKDKLNLHAAQLLFIESADNYSNIVYTENGATKKLLLRGSLKRIENQVSHPSIKRCHRAYIVNLDNVEKIEGNAAGYRLYLTNCSEIIPVSRSYSNDVLQILGKE
jgi:hypothetical protein